VAEGHFHQTDRQHVAGREQAFGIEGRLAEKRAVATGEVADRPARGRRGDLGVEPAGPFVVDHDMVRGGTAERESLAGDEPGDGFAALGVTDEQVGR
jgi:hypothetical protein